MVVLIFAVAMTHDIRLLAIVYVLTFICAYLSKVEIGFFLKRVWVFIPIFAGIIMIPILFNVFTPGDALVTLATLGPNAHLGPFALPPVITITRQGVMMAATLCAAGCDLCLNGRPPFPHNTPGSALQIPAITQSAKGLCPYDGHVLPLYFPLY